MEQWLLAVLAQAAHAPFSLRFVIQPVMAILLGLRDAKRDAQEGRAPYALSLVTMRADRRTLLQNGLRSVALPLSVAVILDGVVQVLVARRIVVWKAVVVGILLIGLPYIVTRGLGNRLFTRVAHRRERHA